jgi:hypothetical protein
MRKDAAKARFEVVRIDTFFPEDPIVTDRLDACRRRPILRAAVHCSSEPSTGAALGSRPYEAEVPCSLVVRRVTGRPSTWTARGYAVQAGIPGEARRLSAREPDPRVDAPGTTP